MIRTAELILNLQQFRLRGEKKGKAASVVIFFLLDTVSLDRDLDRTKLEESNYKRLPSTLFVIP